MANEVKWIKITTDIFDPEGKLFFIERLPDGRDIELIWFKLLVLTGKVNSNGFVVNKVNTPYTDEMLAEIFRMELGTVQRALEIFQRYEMVEVVDNAYMVSNWLEHQHGDRLDEIKKKHCESQKKYREKQKMLAENKSDITRDVTSDVTNDVISSISISNSLSESNSYSLVINNIVSYLNNKLNTNYKSNSKNTVKHIKARLAEGFTEEDFYRVIDIKVAKWGDDPKMAQYLRPDTLFGTKFESYLNEKSADNKKNSTESFLNKWANA